MYLNVKEIFYSLQGEGINMGIASIFIRLSGCNLKCDFCDTIYDNGTIMTLQDIHSKISKYPSRFIIWTGGEPTLQLNDDVIDFFKSKGYTQSIETNGSRAVPSGIDYITCSPKKETISLLKKNFPNGVNEFRFPISQDSELPPEIENLPYAENYLVSPIFVGDNFMNMDYNALDRCIKFVLSNPKWRLSLQIHKLIDIQ